jgi:hypothetical protein
MSRPGAKDRVHIQKGLGFKHNTANSFIGTGDGVYKGWPLKAVTE